MYRISLVSENHGYTIRLERTSYEFKLNRNDRSKGECIEKAETLVTLAIIYEHNTALEVFNGMNTLVTSLVKRGIIKKDVFRYRT